MRRTAICCAVWMCLSLVPAAPVSATEVSPEEIFETVWKTFDERYALFDVKPVDWQALYDVYRPQVTSEATEEELFEILSAMLSHLNDTHVMMSAESIGRDFSAGYLGRYINVQGMAGAMAMLKTRPLPRKYFLTEPKTAGDGRFQYGWVGEGIGYFHFGGFGDVDLSAKAVDSILEDFAGAKAMIIDVRRNSGGDDRVGKAIADRFADSRRLYMTTRDRKVGARHGDFSEPMYWHVDPAPTTFTGPTILLTNRLSVSAAENFALAMRVLPHVTVVGDFTSGCFADMQRHDLPNGWWFSLSKNLFEDWEGRCWEGIGVPPDLMVRGETDGNVDPVFDFAMDLLQGGGPAPQDERGSLEAVRLSLVDEMAKDLQTGGFEMALKDFNRARLELPAENWYVYAGEINALGYELLAADRTDDAVGVFKLYVELFPNDSNAYDSLGEAFMKSGDTERAISAYTTSLELDPGNRNAAEMLKILRE